MGDAFFTAPNPPFGAAFTYYLKESLRTRKQQRQETEKSLEKQGKTINFPGWDTLRQEEREEEPAVILTVKDEAGNVVRRLTGPTDKGLHRIAWDLRYPAIEPTKLEEPRDLEPWDRPAEGPLVVPGTFSVSLAKRVDGVLTSLGKPQVVVVESLGLAALPAKDKKELLEFQKKAGELQRAMMGADEALRQALKNLEFIKKALLETPRAPKELGTEARSLEKQLKDIHIELSGDPIARKRNEPSSPSLLQRVDKEVIQISSTTGITTTNKRNYEISADAFEELLEKLRQLIDVDLKNLEEKMEAAGAPWTPGRGVPKWGKK